MPETLKKCLFHENLDKIQYSKFQKNINYKSATFNLIANKRMSFVSYLFCSLELIWNQESLLNLPKHLKKCLGLLDYQRSLQFGLQVLLEENFQLMALVRYLTFYLQANFGDNFILILPRIDRICVCIYRLCLPVKHL